MANREQTLKDIEDYLGDITLDCRYIERQADSTLNAEKLKTILTHVESCAETLSQAVYKINLIEI